MEIEKKIDELTKEVWRFHFSRGDLYLNSYELMIRESTKHRKYLTVKKYDRRFSRDCTIEEQEIPFSKEIRQEALQAFFKTISCKLWSEK